MDPTEEALTEDLSDRKKEINNGGLHLIVHNVRIEWKNRKEFGDGSFQA